MSVRQAGSSFGDASHATDAGLSRLTFLEHVNSILSAPLPKCLQLERVDGLSTAVNNPSRDALYSSGCDHLSSLLQPSGPAASAIERVRRRGAGVGAVPARAGRPVYERLLEKGRQLSERREELVMGSILEETADLRPAPTLSPNYRHGRLPPEGQRIEDRLLSRARERQEVLEEKRRLAHEQREEALRAAAPFRPAISVRAREARAKYTQPPPEDFEAWRARRKAEIAAARQQREAREAAELEEATHAPTISARSEKLAARRKEREGLGGLDPREALLVREHLRRLQRDGDGDSEPRQPSISRPASRLRRPGDVADRLYAEAAAQDRRRMERAHSRDTTPFRPNITARGSESAPRYDRAAQQTPRRQRPAAAAPSFAPAVDPVSAALARQLPESSWDRLQQPRRRAASGGDADDWESGSGTASEAARWEERAARVAPLPPHVAEALAEYEARRDERLQALREERDAAEQRACTFSPRINPSPAAARRQQVDGGVAHRAERWQRDKDQRLLRLREEKQREEEEELRRCAQWRESTGLYRRRPSRGGSTASADGSVQGSTTGEKSPERRRARPPPTIGSIYQSIYHVDPHS